jgi:hypothetical protein
VKVIRTDQDQDSGTGKGHSNRESPDNAEPFRGTGFFPPEESGRNPWLGYFLKKQKKTLDKDFIAGILLGISNLICHANKHEERLTASDF